MRARVSLLVVSALAMCATFVSAGVAPVVASGAELPRLAARRTVERSVHDAYPQLTFGNVACPSGVRKARGVSFTCTVQLPGTFLVVQAEQTDSSGTVSLSTDQAVIPTQSLRDFVAQHASLPATVDCGTAPLRVVRADTQITCRAALADGTARTVVLTVQDTEGNVTVTSVS